MSNSQFIDPTDPQSKDFNMQSLYFLSKQQLIAICCDKKQILNQTEAMMTCLAQQLAKSTDELNQMQEEKKQYDEEAREKRVKLRNLINYSNSFNHQEMDEEIKQLQETLSKKKNDLQQIEEQ